MQELELGHQLRLRCGAFHASRTSPAVSQAAVVGRDSSYFNEVHVVAVDYWEFRGVVEVRFADALGAVIGSLRSFGTGTARRLLWIRNFGQNIGACNASWKTRSPERQLCERGVAGEVGRTRTDGSEAPRRASCAVARV